MNYHNKVIHIVVFDDYELITDGIAGFFQNEPAFKVVGKALNKEMLFHHLKNQNQVDLILMDIEMPDDRYIGIDMTKEAKLSYPDTKIIMLTKHNKMGLLNHALEYGADGFMLKQNASKSHLKQVIKKVCNDGHLHIDPDVKRGIVVQPGLLSKREREVLCYYVKGKTANEIALILKLSIHTIKEYLANVRNKLELRRKALLIEYAIKNNLCVDKE